MLPTKRLLWRFGSLCQFNPAVTHTSMNGLLIQQSYFARSATASKPAKKKTTSSNKKSASKSKSGSKSRKASSAKKTTAAAKKKTTKKQKAAPKAKPLSVVKSLSKSDQKLLKKYPDPSKPKRPAPAMYYLGKDQVTMPGPAQLASLWRGLDESSKEQYKQRSSSEYPEYRIKKAQYKQREKESVDEWLAIAKQLTQDRPPQSGYSGYFQENREIFKRPNTKFAENVKELASQWNNLGSYEKEEYKSKYSNLYREWKQRVADYYQQ